MPSPLIDLKRLRVFPLAERQSLTRVEEILVDPDAPPGAVSAEVLAATRACAEAVRDARRKKAGVMLIYGAHLLRNGAALLLARMMERGWVTHLATNGAGTIHDWEYAWLGRSTESVRDGVATGKFGTWDETGRNIHLALLAGGIREEGYGRALGRLIWEDGVDLPEPDALQQSIRDHPAHPLTPRAGGPPRRHARACAQGRPPCGGTSLEARLHLAQAFRHGVPASVHPGIGYDIIANHPMFNGGRHRPGGRDRFPCFRRPRSSSSTTAWSCRSARPSWDRKVFEKSLSCVNNLRLQEGRPIVAGHRLFVVDLQDGGSWDWSRGEPPKTNPAYYLRFCKSFARMGGALTYVQSDNVRFLHHVYQQLAAGE